VNNRGFHFFLITCPPIELETFGKFPEALFPWGVLGQSAAAFFSRHQNEKWSLFYH